MYIPKIYSSLKVTSYVTVFSLFTSHFHFDKIILACEILACQCLRPVFGTSLTVTLVLSRLLIILPVSVHVQISAVLFGTCFALNS